MELSSFQRGTGRTTRMVAHAVRLAETDYGTLPPDDRRRIVIVMPNCTLLAEWRHRIAAGFLNQISFMLATNRDIDWERLTVRGYGHNTVVLFDHAVLEHRFGAVVAAYCQFLLPEVTCCERSTDR
jgi:hypothetical protein